MQKKLMEESYLINQRHASLSGTLNFAHFIVQILLASMSKHNKLSSEILHMSEETYLMRGSRFNIAMCPVPLISEYISERI